MEFDSIQMTLIAIFLVCAVSMVVVCDFLRKTFLRPAAERHRHGRHRRSRSNFEGHALHSSPGLSETAKRAAVPVCAEVIGSGQKPESGETRAALEPPAAQAASPLPHAIDAYLWECVHDGAGAVAGSRDPCSRGMISQADWQEAIASAVAFTGVAVSISVNDLDGSMWHSPALMRSVSQDIAGLLGDHGFGCRTAYDEFLIACPQEQNRPERLKQITKRLWECQLRGQRARSVRIAWGGAEVRNQPLTDALASATERMRQSQRTSETIALTSVAVASGERGAGATASCRARRKAV